MLDEALVNQYEKEWIEGQEYYHVYQLLEFIPEAEHYVRERIKTLQARTSWLKIDLFLSFQRVLERFTGFTRDFWTKYYEVFIGQDLLENEREIKKLKSFYNVFLISADTRGNLNEIALKLGITPIRISKSDLAEAEVKNNELMKLGQEETVAIGNGNNDFIMLKNAILGIAILGQEGLASKTLQNSDLVFSNCIDAIQFLMDEKKIIATLRK